MLTMRIGCTDQSSLLYWLNDSGSEASRWFASYGPEWVSRLQVLLPKQKVIYII